MNKNLIKIYHLVIITSLILGLSACGYKGSPKYVESTTQASK